MPGQRIGKYEVLSQLSAGGMAELFLAFTQGPGGFRKYVVLKRIHPTRQRDPSFVKMFMHEAQLSASLSHPNLAQVFDLGEEPDGKLFLAMEFVAGQNLNQVMGTCARRRTPLPLGFSAAVGIEVAHALHYAHTFKEPGGRPKPVVHRDVGQKNVMVTYDGAVKLLDFGIAKSAEDAAGNLIKGTLGYMSPEQVAGEPLDGRSDVFSLGVVLYELFTGRRLYASAVDLDAQRAEFERPVLPPSEVEPLVSDAMSSVVMRALAKERADRYATAKELAKALQKATGKLLFDSDGRGAFMRELFEPQMEATQALLDSADGKVDGGQVARAAAVLTEQAVDSFPELPIPLRPPSTRPDVPQTISQDGRFEAVRVESDSAKGTLARANRWMRVLSISGALALSAVIGSTMMRSPPHFLSIFQEPEATAEARRMAAVPLHPVPIEEPPPARPQKRRGVGGSVRDAEPPSGRRGARGTLTLVTFPESVVMRGDDVLGVTPLFNKSLPQGTHVLTLKGRDGRSRLLSVPISPGKNTAFRLRLDELPSR